MLAMAQRREPDVIMDINGKPWNINNPEARVAGTPWLSMDWGKGYVQLLNGKRADSILMNFDLEYHRPMYTYAGAVYEFRDSVQEFKFDYVENSVQKTAFFKSGYPAASRHKASTLYQVLAEGPKYELLKYSDKKSRERRDYNGPMKIHYELYSELYIYNSATQTMRKIQNKLSSVIKALPAREKDINKICREKNLSLKTEEQVALLIGSLQ